MRRDGAAVLRVGERLMWYLWVPGTVLLLIVRALTQLLGRFTVWMSR